MDIKEIVSEVLKLPLVVQTNLDSWNFEQVFQFSLEVAVVVMKKTSSASKEANAVLVSSVVCEVIDLLKKKALSSVAPEKSTEVSQHWDTLKNFASGGLPVVLSYLPQLNLPRSLLDCFSFCRRVSSAVEVTPVKDTVVAGVSGLDVVGVPDSKDVVDADVADLSGSDVASVVVVPDVSAVVAVVVVPDVSVVPVVPDIVAKEPQSNEIETKDKTLKSQLSKKV